jgi:hypothetical protein
MLQRKVTLVVVLAAATVLMGTVAAASAARLSISNQNIRTVVPLGIELGGGFSIITGCRITLEGSFHSRTFVKTRGLLVGYVTRAAVDVGGCVGSTLILLGATLAWHIRYAAFSGALPNITTLTFQIPGFSLLVNPMGFSCLYQATSAQPAQAIASVGAGGRITGLRFDETASIPLVAGALCPAEARLSGHGEFTVLGGTTAVTISLI